MSTSSRFGAQGSSVREFGRTIFVLLCAHGGDSECRSVTRLSPASRAQRSGDAIRANRCPCVGGGAYGKPSHLPWSEGLCARHNAHPRPGVTVQPTRSTRRCRWARGLAALVLARGDFRPGCVPAVTRVAASRVLWSSARQDRCWRRSRSGHGERRSVRAKASRLRGW